MSKLNTLGLLAILGAAPVAGLTTFFPQGGTSSAKATARVTGLNLIDSSTQQGWTTIMSSKLKCSNQKDVFVDVSLECGLVTKTVVTSKNATRDTSTADAGIEVRVLIDGQPILPGHVIFARRRQQLSAVFQGIVADSFRVDPATGNVVLDESTVTPEELELVLDTTNAASFNFIAPNVATGVHTIQVQTRVDTNVTFETGTAEAYALIGKGSVTVEEYRAAQGDEIAM